MASTAVSVELHRRRIGLPVRLDEPMAAGADEHLATARAVVDAVAIQMEPVIESKRVAVGARRKLGMLLEVRDMIVCRRQRLARRSHPMGGEIGVPGPALLDGDRGELRGAALFDV